MRRQNKRWLLLVVSIAAFLVLIANNAWWETGLRWLFPEETVVLHPRASLLILVWEHIQLVVISSAITVTIGVPLGI